MRQDHFLIKAVNASKPYRLTITFGDNATMTVDLKETIGRIPALSSLKDKELFSSAVIEEHGLSVEWRQGELDMAGDNLRAKAIEQAGGISHERIWEWMHKNDLTLDAAAEALGISRRMLAYYRSGQKPIPKHIWLACIGWESQKSKAA